MYGEIGDESNKKTSQETLYTCLDTALKCTAPFMPFISEELWQRLPRRATDKAASVHVSRFPAETDFTRDNKAEENIDLMMNVIKGIRSIRGEYKLTNKQKTEVFLETKSNDVKTILESTSDFIRCLSFSEKITFSNQIPAGCVISVVNDDVNANIMLKVCIDHMIYPISYSLYYIYIYVFLQGVIDFEKEKIKMEKNMKDLENKLKALEKKMSNKDYKAKVPQNVQDQDAEKCESFKIEIQESKKAIESITSLL